MAIADIRKNKVKIIKDTNIITETVKEKTTIYLTPTVKTTLKKLAIDEKQSISFLIETALKKQYNI